MKTTLLLDHCPREPRGWLVRGLLRIEGEAPVDAARLPLNLSLVLDRSGSMNGRKLEAAKDAAAHLVQRLGPDDRISVVVYDNDVDTLVPPTPGRNGDEVQRAIVSIYSGGSTNLSGGWMRGRELVAMHQQPNAINRILLLTDGLANVGIKDPAQLAGLAGTACERGISTTTIGFGADFDEHLLRAMADAGGGQTYYIELPDQAPAVFAHELQGLLGVCAQNVTVQLIAQEGLLAVRHAYPAVDAQTDAFLLGDLYAAAPKPLLFEILLDHAPTLLELQVAQIVVSGTVITSDGIEQRTISLPIKIDLSRGAFTEPAIERESLLLQAAQTREAALDARARGDYDGARVMLRRMAERLRQYGLSDADLQEEAADMEGSAMLMQPALHTVANEKYLFQRAHDTRRGTYDKKHLISREERKRRPQ